MNLVILEILLHNEVHECLNQALPSLSSQNGLPLKGIPSGILLIIRPNPEKTWAAVWNMPQERIS